MNKKILPLLIALCMVLSLAVPAIAASSVKCDVKNNVTLSG